MIKLDTRLMFPNPGDNGGGAPANTPQNPTPAPETPTPEPAPKTEEKQNSDPYDFGQFAEEQTDEQGTPTPEPQEETYALGFTEEDGIGEKYVNSLTDKAKELAMPAEATTEFVRFLRNMLNEEDDALKAAEDKALRQEWGKQFDDNRKQVGAYMGRIFNQLGLSREQMLEFASPAHYRLFHHVMKQNSEKAAVTAPAHLTPEQKSARLQELARERVRLRYSNDNEGAERVTAEINRISMEKYGHGAYL